MQISSSKQSKGLVMKLEFESNLEYQKTAISAVIELFKGQSKHTAWFNLYSNGNNDPITPVKKDRKSVV